MEPWIDIAELSVWVQEAIPPEDPFATMILKASTIVVNEATGYADTVDEFTAVTAPDRIKVVLAQVAKRNYLNPTQITREGNIGPLGGDTYAAAYAAGMTLTEEEEAVIAKTARRAVEGGANIGGLGILTFNVAHNPVGRASATHLPDTSGTGGFAAGSDWQITYG